MNMFKNILIGEKTDQGLKRENNEDNYVIVDHTQQSLGTEYRGLMFAVADGDHVALLGLLFGRVGDDDSVSGLLDLIGSFDYQAVVQWS